MRSILLVLVLSALLTVAGCVRVERLPAPVVHGNSFEILSNSRYSVHSGFSGDLPRQVLANVLWAMSQVPAVGSYREFYVATSANVYRYDPKEHTLSIHRASDHRAIPGSAFEIGIATDNDIEAGYAVQAGLLAGVAFWDSAGGDVVSCPMARPAQVADSGWKPQHPIKIVNVYGRFAAKGLQRALKVQSSDSSLPALRIAGSDTFEMLLRRLHQDSAFDSRSPSLSELSQILWAGYGVTPHVVSGNRQGLTVPSAVARYFLTGRIYVVRDAGVFRYENRMPPGSDFTTSDHRLELLTAEDRRNALRAACPRLPSSAPVYIIVCVEDASQGWAVQEAGYAGFQFLMQAEQLGLGGCLTAPLTAQESRAVVSALGLPSGNAPVLIFSAGPPVRR